MTKLKPFNTGPFNCKSCKTDEQRVSESRAEQFLKNLLSLMPKLHRMSRKKIGRSGKQQLKSSTKKNPYPFNAVKCGPGRAESRRSRFFRSLEIYTLFPRIVSIG